MKTTGFPPEMVANIILRDGGICQMCGAPAQTANHRSNRGAGGTLTVKDAIRRARATLNRMANGCALCNACNGAIEDDGPLADQARQLGIKLNRDDIPEDVPMWSRFFRRWVWLTDTELRITEFADINTRPEPQS